MEGIVELVSSRKDANVGIEFWEQRRIGKWRGGWNWAEAEETESKEREGC